MLQRVDDTDVTESETPLYRWLYFLRWTGSVTDDTIEVEGSDGKFHVSQIDNVVKASAKACSECSAYEAIL